MDQTSALDLDWMVSVDDHVLEPGNLWQQRVPASMRDDAPKLVRSDGEEFWVYAGKRIATLGLAAVAGKSREDFSPDPVTYDDMRPGCYDPIARVADMDQAGVLASLSFPSFPRFCGQVFYEGDDKQLGEVCLDAWNDWMLEDWCGAAPGRFIPLMLIPLWDPKLAARKVEQYAARGVHALAFSENPVPLGLPSIHDAGGYWEPVWEAAAANDVIVCMHQGSSSTRPRSAPDTPELAVMAWAIGALQSAALLDWLFSGVFERHPNLKICLAEGGIGWMPYVLERAEQVLDKQKFWASSGDLRIESAGSVTHGASKGADYMTLDIRKTFAEHVFGCFIVDEHGVASLDKIGVDNVMAETDYPHSDSTWPDCIGSARRQLAGLSDEATYKILRGNAERLFSFTPAAPPAKLETTGSAR